MNYVELRCKTNYSFLEGASHPEELVVRAKELGYRGLAITDRSSLAGVVRAYAAAKDHALKLIVGAELDPVDASPVLLWAPHRRAYGKLARLITVGRQRASKGKSRFTFADLATYADELLAGVLADPERDPSHTHSLAAYRDLFGDRCYLVGSLLRDSDDAGKLQRYLQFARTMRVPLVAAGNVHYHDPSRLPLQHVLTAIRQHTTVSRDRFDRDPDRSAHSPDPAAPDAPLVAPDGADVWFPNAERHLRATAVIEKLYRDAPEALHRTLEIADRCRFSLDELRYEYPEELAPAGETPIAYLTRLTWEGARQRYPGGIPAKVVQLLEHELVLIAELKYEAYFLTVWDLVRFARSRGILCQGRGSAANSAVCYCLGVTAVDPDRTDLLFERFISRERDEAPDIDVDFEHERREEVLQYIYGKYGRERAGMTGVVITYRTRSAIRDVGKALGFPPDQVDALAKNTEGYHTEPRLADRCREIGVDPDSRRGRQWMALVEQLVGFPRHLSQHVGGMVITNGPLCELAPIENAAMPGRTVIEWNKDDLDELGILKVDCLSLGMLTAIRKCLDLIHQSGIHQSGIHPSGITPQTPIPTAPSATIPSSTAASLPSSSGHRSPDGQQDAPATGANRPAGARRAAERWTLATIPAEDPRVYDLICKADTMGVFQIESRAQMSMLPRLKPRTFYDLVIEVAIVRPGPIQGQMVHPYLRRRAGEEHAIYPSDAIRAVLEKTLGVPIFQEQAMRLAVVAAGFTPGEADQLRRAMGAWRRPGIIDQFRRKLLQGMQSRGLSQAFAEQVFQQIRGFGEYGFPESHAASFALLVYASAWLKCYFPAAFTAALINSQPMGFYAPAQLIRDARNHGVRVMPVDVNSSDWDCTLQLLQEPVHEPVRKPTSQRNHTHHAAINDATSSHALRLGFRMLNGFSRQHADKIVAMRGPRPFTSIDDFARRTQLTTAVLEQLADADAFGTISRDRRAALWNVLGQDPRQSHRPLLLGLDDDEPEPDLPELSMQEQVFMDYLTTGLSLKSHPMAFFRAGLEQLRVTPAGDLESLPNNRIVRVAGLVLLRQRPSTAKGITFVTLEDETGMVNLVVKQPIWERYYAVARRSCAWIAHGPMQCKDGVIHVVANRLEDLSAQLGNLTVPSRDFR